MVEKRGRAYLVLILFALFVFKLFLPMGQIKTTFAKENTESVNYISKVHFINVGQGDCTFIEFPDGQTCIIDGGAESYGMDVVRYIQDLGYEQIDYMIATHSDSDHIGGLLAVLVNFEVKTIFRPFIQSSYSSIGGDSVLAGFSDVDMEYLNIENVLTESSLSYAKFIDFAYKETYDGKLSEIVFLSDRAINDLFQNNNTIFSLQVISPFADTDSVIDFPDVRATGYGLQNLEVYADANKISAVVVYSLTDKNNTDNKIKFMFCADMPSEIEETLVERASKEDGFKDRVSNMDCLKVAHHGSDKSSSAKFLELTQPKVAIISVGENDYGHPNAETLERLSVWVPSSNIFRTDISGNVVIKISDNFELFTTIKSVQRGIPSWVLYLVFGIIIFCVIAIIVINIIQKRIMKKKGITDCGKDIVMQNPNFQGNEGNNSQYYENETKYEDLSIEDYKKEENSESSKVSQLQTPKTYESKTNSRDKSNNKDKNPYKAVESVKIKEVKNVDFQAMQDGQITLLTPEELEKVLSKKRKR